MIFPSDFRISPPLTPRHARAPASIRAHATVSPSQVQLGVAPFRAATEGQGAAGRLESQISGGKVGNFPGKKWEFPKGFGKKWEVPKGFEGENQWEVLSDFEGKPW